MHLPAQYECMPRGAERENGLSGESNTGRRKTHGRAEGVGERRKKTLKPQYDRWRELSERDREKRNRIR